MSFLIISKKFMMLSKKLLKDIKKIKKKNNSKMLTKSIDLDVFTSETKNRIDEIFLKEDFELKEIFKKIESIEDKKKLEENLIQTADRVDITIMYQIIDRFQKFVYSLTTINEIKISFENCMNSLSIVKTTNRRELGNLLKYNKAIIKKSRKLKNFNAYLDQLNKVNEMKNIFININSHLNQQDFDEALSLYFDFKEELEKNTNGTIVKFFKSYFNILSLNLTNFLRNNFENQFLNYFTSSFEYYNQYNEQTLINEVNCSVNITYDFEVDNLNWIICNRDRNIDLEYNITKSILSLLQISTINLKGFQTKLVDLYDSLNNKLSNDLKSFCERKQQTKNYNNRFQFNALKFFFEIHFSSLKKFLFILNSIFVESFMKFVENKIELSEVLFSKEYVILENLYQIFLVLIQKSMTFLKSFSTLFLEQLFFQDMKNYGVLLKEIFEKMKEEIFNSLFPKFETKETHLNMYKKLITNIGYNFSIKEYEKFHSSLESTFIISFQTLNINQIKVALQQENWQEINISYDLKENIQNSLGYKDDIKIKTDNVKLWLNEEKFYISKSFAKLVYLLDCYIQLIGIYNSQENLIATFICDLIAFYNNYSFKIILEGECLNFKAIKKIDAFLIVFLQKELEMLNILLNIFYKYKIINNPNKFNILEKDIQDHQQNLKANFYALIKDYTRIQSEKLEEYNWEENMFQFLSPSIESCNIINYLTDMFKQIDQFLNKQEFSQVFDAVVKIIIDFFISRMENFIQISEQNIQNLNNERKFIIENLDNLKQSILAKK